MLLIHHPLYLLLATIVSILGSWTALDLFLRVRVWVGQPRAAWLIAATLAMGLSVWAMHFIAILAFDVGSAIRFDLALSALSMVLAVAGTGFAFAVAGGRRPSRLKLIGAGAVMGLGIGLMHYTGFAALEGSTVFGYRPLMVTLTFALSMLACTGVLSAMARGGPGRWRVMAAVAVGLAIVAMHLAAVASVRILPRLAGGEGGGFGAMGLASAVAAVTLFILFLASVAALFDRRFEAVAAVEAKRSEAQLRSLLEHMPIGIIVCDAPGGGVRFANPEAAHLLGMEVPTAPPWDWPRTTPSLNAKGVPKTIEEYGVYRAVRLGERTDEFTRFERPDGKEVIFEQTAAPVRDADGRIIQAIVTFQDVTQRTKAQEALRQSQRMEGIGQLTGGVAHDFNNVLTAILGSLSIAARRVDDKRAGQMIDNAIQAARRGAALTAQLLAFSRRQKLKTEPVDINDAIDQLSALFNSTMGGAIRVITDLGEDLPAALADPAQLELALLNLALNARDAMPDGGELVLATSVETLGPPRSDSEPERGRYVCIEISDTGFGMTPEVMARAFEPFFTTKAPGKGSGLGLSQVLGLAKQLGGGVSIESEPGEGAAIRLYLPVSSEPARAPAPRKARPTPAPAAVGGARVLVVDDDDDVRRFITDLLTEHGCVVRAEADGAAGLAALDGEAFDLILLDYAMPEMTGAEVARIVRQRQPDAPMLIMTGYLEHEAVLAELGAQPILQKPFEPAELLSRVESTLRRAPGR